MYRIYLTNFGWYIDGSFETLSDAKKECERRSFQCRVGAEDGMKTWRVINRMTGWDFGIYAGDTADDAIAEMLADAGHDGPPDEDVGAVPASDPCDVRTYCLAYIDLSVTLCAHCMDRSPVALGPCEHGLHTGVCDACASLYVD